MGKMPVLRRRPSPVAFAVVLLPFIVSAASSACSSSSSSSEETPSGGGGDDAGGSTPQGGDASTGGGDSGSAPGAQCKKNDDCASKVCDIPKGVCKAPTCNDGTKNQDEADIDCGGACPKCDVLKACKGNADCTTGVCADTGKGMQCQPPACTDVVKNGTESDVDCGGDKCAKCADGKACKVRGDCASDVCIAGKCATPVCDDGAKNGTETDVDCGGPGCPRCDDTKACTTTDDCKSGVCTGNVCQPPACNVGGAGGDGVKNGTETDVDCGGPGCDGCATGQSCTLGTDCASKGCNYLGKCAAGRSCTQRYGGDTCGLGGAGGRGAAQWEDCCARAPVTPTAGPTKGKTVMMDKYQVTAGRMRVFLESVGYNVRAFVQQARADGKIPLVPNQAGNNAGHTVLEPEWDLYLPVSFLGNTDAGEIAEGDQGAPNTPQQGIYTSIYNHLGGLIFKNNAQSSTGCYVGSPGTHAFRFPNGQQDGATPDYDQNVYDTKSMQCIDYLVAQAFCVWEGGRLHLGTEWVAAWGPGTLPWSWEAAPNPTPRPPAVIGDNTYYGCRFPTVDDATYPGDCTPSLNPATQTIEYADYRYSYEYPNLKNTDYIVFISAPGRTRGRGPNGHADIIGTNFSATSDVVFPAGYNGTPMTNTTVSPTHGWSASGSWEVHAYSKPASGVGPRTMLLNKYGKLGLRCSFD